MTFREVLGVDGEATALDASADLHQPRGGCVETIRKPARTW